MQCWARFHASQTAGFSATLSLRAGKSKCKSSILGSDEVALDPSARGQPRADAIVHELLYAICPPVGEPVHMVWAGRAKDDDPACQRRFAARAHVQRLDSQQDDIYTDYRSSPRIRRRSRQ